MESALTAGLVSAVITLVGYLVSIEKVRVESDARRAVEKELDKLRAELERMNVAHAHAVEEMTTARLRFLELAVKAAGQVTSDIHELRNRVGAFRSAVQRSELKGCIRELNAFQFARRSLLKERMYLPPQLDKAFDDTFEQANLVLKELVDATTALIKKEQASNPPSAGVFSKSAVKDWDASVVAWKNEVWNRVVGSST
jgi:hypothetical protein